MTDKQTPADWVLIEAAKRCGWGYPLTTLRCCYGDNPLFVALCDMIEKHEQPPVDRKLLCAREASKMPGDYANANATYVNIEFTKQSMYSSAIRAIELWEEGFGK